MAVISKTSEAADHFTRFTVFAGMNASASSEQTRNLLGWEPKQPGLIADIDKPGYFKL